MLKSITAYILLAISIMLLGALSVSAFIPLRFISMEEFLAAYWTHYVGIAVLIILAMYLGSTDK